MTRKEAQVLVTQQHAFHKHLLSDCVPDLGRATTEFHSLDHIHSTDSTHYLMWAGPGTKDSVVSKTDIVVSPGDKLEWHCGIF